MGYENLKRILERNPDGFPVYSPIIMIDNFIHRELADEFGWTIVIIYLKNLI